MYFCIYLNSLTELWKKDKGHTLVWPLKTGINIKSKILI